MNENLDVISKAHAQAVTQVQRQLAPFAGSEIAQFLGAMASAREVEVNGTDKRTRIGPVDITADLQRFENGPMERLNAMSRAFRASPRMTAFPTYPEMVKSNGALAKAAMDVGALTDLAQVTGGQSLGFISLDTNMARGTIRPGSFTLYQLLKKTRANQIVDYWPYAAEIGGALPGAAFNAYSSAATGTMATSAGQYNLQTITLRMALDGRAITAALAAQNSFVDITGQETTNAALVVLQSLDWALFWGNPAIFPNQPSGLQQQILANAPSKNIIDFQVYKTAMASAGLSDQQLLFNLIFQQVSQMVGYRVYGIPTHAVMGVGTAGDLQSLVTTQIQQFANQTRADHSALVINGNVQGMNTRFGDIHFPVDLLMTSRDYPAEMIVYDDGSTPATLTNPTKPVSVTVAVSGAHANSDWTAAFVTASGIYTYAVATCDSLMNESTLTYAAGVSGIAVLGAYVLTITPPASHDQYAYRVYRSGKGASSVTLPRQFRHIGDILAVAGAGTTTYLDLNTKIPGSESVFILDLDEQDDAFDYRWLLPLTKIELFAQNLFMPWAVAHIGSPRVRIPKFHGMITNYTPRKSDFDAMVADNS